MTRRLAIQYGIESEHDMRNADSMRDHVVCGRMSKAMGRGVKNI